MALPLNQNTTGASGTPPLKSAYDDRLQTPVVSQNLAPGQALNLQGALSGLPANTTDVATPANPTPGNSINGSGASAPPVSTVATPAASSSDSGFDYTTLILPAVFVGVVLYFLHTR